MLGNKEVVSCHPYCTPSLPGGLNGLDSPPCPEVEVRELSTSPSLLGWTAATNWCGILRTALVNTPRTYWINGVALT